MRTLVRRLVVAMLLGVAVYGGFALWNGFAKTQETLSRFSWSAFAAACGLAFGNYMLRFLKWEFYLAKLGIRGVPKVDSLLTFLSAFVLTVTPGKVGEVFKSYLLEETHRVPLARTATIVVAERLTDVIGVVVLILVGSAGFSGGLGWALAGLALVAIALVAISSEGFCDAIIARIERSPGKLGALGPKVRTAWESLRVMTRPSALVVPALLSIVAWSLECLALWVILRGFHAPVSPWVSCFFYATATLAGALVPVPGGLGVTEPMLKYGLQTVGGAGESVATTAMILVRFATLWFAVLVGFVALGLLRLRFPRLMAGHEVLPTEPAPEV